MNSVQLKCFLEVAKELNFARAAENLHFSQPTVSKQIQTLENELKVKLFERSTRSVSLTHAGKLFYPNARSIYNQELDAVYNLSKLDAELAPRIFIGTYGLEVFSYMQNIYPALFKQIPNLQPDIIFAPYQSLNSSLSANSIDLILGTKELIEEQNSSKGTYTKLTDAPITYVLPKHFSKEHPDTLLRRVTVPILESTLRSHLNIYEVAGDFANENVQYCDNIESAFLQVRSGHAFLIIGHPKKLWNPELQQIIYKKASPFSYGYYSNPDNKKETLKILKKELKKYFD